MDNEYNIPTPKDTSKLKKVFEDDGYNKMNEAIGRMLKRLRKEHNMSVKDVKQRLHMTTASTRHRALFPTGMLV